MNFEICENNIGYSFKNKNLLKEALTHTSYAYENKVKSNERLEYLGDSILEFVISEYLFLKYNNLSEGEMTKVRASYVCENALYRYSMDMGFNNYIKVGHGEENSGGKYKKAIVADIFEAIMGAIYLDLGYETVRRVILDIVVPYIQNPNIVFFEDYKSALQQAVQTTRQSVIYEVVKEEGPAHDKTFTIEAKVDGIIYGKGVGSSKKDAEQIAAKDALEKLAKS